MYLQNSGVKEFKALSNPLRLRMLSYLDKPRTVKQVADEMGMRPHTLYHHMRVLEACGLVRLVRRKKRKGSIEEKYYALTEGYKQSKGPDMVVLEGKKDILEHALALLSEYRRSIEFNPDKPCKSCTKRLTVRSGDCGEMQKKLKLGIERLVEENLDPFVAPDGDATFIFNAIGFIK
jgi:DNA-binding transcriptional ArsR family regulator